MQSFFQWAGGKSIKTEHVMAAHRRLLPALMVAAVAALAFTTAFAQEHPPTSGERPQHKERAAPGPGVLRLLPADAVSEHAIDVGGRKLAYTATAGTLSLYEQSGERMAAIFYTAYVAKNAAPNRPLTFVFNGGPGAASAFLHLGLVGPRILSFGPSGRDPAAAKLVDNPDTWLAFTDLVLVDPIGTGWSRAAKPDGGSDFWGVESDASSLAKFIALYAAKNNRIGSPKYILGESYGGFRAAKIARALQREQSMFLSGIVMMSPMLDGALQFGGNRFALGAALQLPSLVAAELDRQEKFSKPALAAAERFAMTDYLTTLAGPPPTGETARKFYAKVADLTGLPVDVVTRSRGYVGDAYVKHLRSAEGKVVSRYDASFAIDDPFPERESGRGPDPVLDGFVRAYGSAFVAYARQELGFKTEITYQLLARDVTRKWDWGGHHRAQPSVTDDLRVLLALDPSFRLMVAHGYSDLVTPYAVSRYLLDHLPPRSGPERVFLHLYRGGHMFYTDAQSRHAFTADAKTLIEAKR
jgi:carboxypeptidase C (cathepsin A)